MTQTVSFFIEYAQEAALLWCGALTVLLIFTLHRIRKISKLIQGITGNTKALNRMQKSQGFSELSQENSMGVDTPGMQQTDAMQKPSDEMGARAQQEQAQTKEQQKLLSEVLDEVFP